MKCTAKHKAKIKTFPYLVSLSSYNFQLLLIHYNIVLSTGSYAILRDSLQKM